MYEWMDQLDEFRKDELKIQSNSTFALSFYIILPYVCWILKGS